MSANSRPIIVIRKKAVHGGHHGGAWKVAYADFVTAMMALFIVLWLMSQSEQVKKAVAGYFNDPKGTATLMGTTMSATGNLEVPDDPNRQLLEQLKEKLEKEIQAKKELEKLIKQIEITITSEGLRIELLEDKNGTFYETGSAHLSTSGQELLALLASELKTLPNQLLIEGHTDANPYTSDANYSNWELSADRANSARRLLQQSGVRSDQVTQVRGYADQFLRVKNDPYDSSNRRISILVKNTPLSATVPAHARVIDGLEPKSPGSQPDQQTGQNPKAPETSSPASPRQDAKTHILSKVRSLLPGRKN